MKKPKVREAAPKAYDAREKSWTTDGQGSVRLGEDFANRLFAVSLLEDGSIVLRPIEDVHPNELWFYRNAEAQLQVQKGVLQSRRGEGKYLGSFTQFKDTDIECSEPENK